jgi:hypothetical protein
MAEPTSTPSLLEHFGPEHSPHFVVFAPGDQGRLSDSATSAIATGLAKAGIHGIRFASPPPATTKMERFPLTNTWSELRLCAVVGQRRVWRWGCGRGWERFIALVDGLNFLWAWMRPCPFTTNHRANQHRGWKRSPRSGVARRWLNRSRVLPWQYASAPCFRSL